MVKLSVVFASVLFLAAGIGAASAQDAQKRTPAPAGAECYFHYPWEGAVTKPRITVRFGLRNMGVAPAGITKEATGHHHLLIDTDLPPLDLPIPADDNHIHFGGGQTEIRVNLTPGKHTLQLLLGDHDHVPHDPPVMSQKITIMVQP